MNLALWIIAGVLALVFAVTGLMKLLLPKDRFVAAGQGWAQNVSPMTLRFIGTAEALGVIGLILPGITHIAPVLVPIAAVGLALLIAGVTVTHTRLKQLPYIVVNLVLMALAVILAGARFGPYAVTS
jgi:hypothetical protein